MNRQNPSWLQQTQEFCSNSGITIVAWGPDLLTVEAKSEERAEEIATLLGQIGFRVVKDDDDAAAGLLSLSKNPVAIEAKIASFDISRRPWDEQIVPLIWALVASLLLRSFAVNSGRYHWLIFLLGALFLVLFLWDGRRIWGWRLETPPRALRVRREFRWITISWDQIRSVKSVEKSRNQESVVVELASSNYEQLGTFKPSFARNLRDRLRIEIANRGGEHQLTSGTNPQPPASSPAQQLAKSK